MRHDDDGGVFVTRTVLDALISGSFLGIFNYFLKTEVKRLKPVTVCIMSLSVSGVRHE